MDDKEIPQGVLDILKDSELDERGKYPFEKKGFFKNTDFEELDFYGDVDDPMYFHSLED